MQIWFACLSPMFGTCHVYSTLTHFTKEVVWNPGITCDANKTQYVSKVGPKGCPTQPTLPHEHCGCSYALPALPSAPGGSCTIAQVKNKQTLPQPQDSTGAWQLFLQPGWECALTQPVRAVVSEHREHQSTLHGSDRHWVLTGIWVLLHKVQMWTAQQGKLSNT